MGEQLLWKGELAGEFGVDLDRLLGGLIALVGDKKGDVELLMMGRVFQVLFKTQPLPELG